MSGSVRRLFQRAMRGREDLSENLDGSEGTPKGPGGVKRLSQRAGGLGRPSKSDGRGREALLEGWEGSAGTS